MELKKIDSWRWEVPKTGSMRVPGMIYASEKMIPHILQDKAHQQVINVAHLPGILQKSLAMPDIHWGYGFPIGGVAAMEYETGVISPGGIGYDINCGVRLLRTNLKIEDIKSKLNDLVDMLFVSIPSGVGSTGKLSLNNQELMDVLKNGAKWAVEKGFGVKEDCESIEEEGFMSDADPTKVSHRALERGRAQLGTLGSGNHFLEIQKITEIYDEAAARVLDLFLGQITIMIHTGSRGLGYQVCDDYLVILQQATKKYGIFLPDRQLACAPITSDEGMSYYKAMCAAANYAWANRQIITHWTRQVFTKVLGMKMEDIGLQTVYDVAHNIGKIEEHMIDGKKKKVVVHRKGATRAFPKHHPAIPQKYKEIGQPVIIPGSMGTSSYVLVGTEKAMSESFGSTCHGSGRTASRSQALRQISVHELQSELARRGIIVKAKDYKTLTEEAPSAYKNVDEVVEVCHQAGISRKIAKMSPLAVIKG